MISYIAIFGPYYGIVLLIFGVWGLLLWGAIGALRRHGGRLRRMQVEGAALILIGTVSKWVVFDTLVGLNRLETDWAYWFSRGEVGIFMIGLLLFGLGYFLERRPRPGLVPWPSTVKSIGITGILIGLGLGMAAFKFFQYPWLHLPWSMGRVVFSLGMYPFALGYVVLGRRIPDPPVEP